MNSIDIKHLLSEMTVEEKASLCSGADFWHTKTVERLGLPNIMVSDGPHGLRKQDDAGDHVGLLDSIKAVCFPASCALASSYDRDLAHEVGVALGEECQAEEISTILGPGVNMKRSPLCGRNFEYLSEDPFLAGELAANYVNGVQSQQVGTSVKHFAVNNQETKRMSISAEVDERTLREIYLAAYETVVKSAQPWTMMCSYNCINGVYSCENDWLLNQVLRKEWGFKGLVMTDWGAMNDRVKSLKAGLELEMPSSNEITDQFIVQAVDNGQLSMEELDLSVTRILELVKKYYDGHKENATYDKETHHKLVRKVAGESAVLLKNEDHILPLKKSDSVVFIGEFAVKPRYQGGGSSHINSFKVTNAIESAQAYGISYVKGFDILKEELDPAEVEKAVKAAKDASVAVVFAGLPDAYESEGYDRTHLNLPSCQNTLIDEITKVQPNTVVVLHNGSPVLMPWLPKVKAVLEMYLGGQAVGEATVDLLYGVVNPSGKLAETFPLRLQDNPSYLNFPGTNRQVEYREGVFIGYRHYDSKELPVLFPFGHGLSYTTFEYHGMTLKVVDNYAEIKKNNKLTMKDTEKLEVSVKVKNTGKCFGKEVVQLYVHDKEASVIRPEKELKGFAKVALAPGEEEVVTFILDKRAFAFYDVDIHDWHAESGDFVIMVGRSSREINLSDIVTIESTAKVPFVFDDRTTVNDVLNIVDDPDSLIKAILKVLGSDKPIEEDTTGEGLMLFELIKGLPLHSLRSFYIWGLDRSIFDDAIAKAMKK